MGKTITKGVTLGATETVTNTKLHNLVDNATFTSMTDADNDTKIQTEESSDEDIIRFDTAGTERVTIQAGKIEPTTDDNMDLGASAKEFKDLYVDGTANIDVLKADALGAAIDHTNFASTNVNIDSGAIDGVTIGGAAAPTVTDLGSVATCDINGGTINGITSFDNTGTATFNETSNDQVVIIDNDGTNHGLEILQDGILASAKSALKITAAPEIPAGGDNAVLRIQTNNGSSTHALMKLDNNGTGVQILGESNENLSNAGVWTDRTSTYADKEDISEITNPEFIDKLKALKLFSYRKKSEVYGGKQYDEVDSEEITKGEFDKGEIKHFKKANKFYKLTGEKKYPKNKKRPTSRVYKGYILDDPSTPEELVSKDIEGAMNGVSAADGVNFLLGVCKELIGRIEVLEVP